ncbi:MAG: hypothetical protein JNJ61_02955 [Anaerolineae bacterium]|nr:hypothetical protein [Anaerolineae bacterium]
MTPVIINDFEVVVEPPPPAPPTSSEPPSEPPALRPEDIEQIMQFFYERRARLHAD